MDNIAFFNRLTLSVFDLLYSSFPTPIDIDVNSLAMDIIPAGDEHDQAWNKLVAAGNTLEFLEKEGFLTHKGTYLEGGTVLHARLTLKGLTILGSTPDSLDEKKSLIDRIRKVVAGGVKEAGAEAVKQLAHQAFTAAIAAAPVIAASVMK